MVEHMPIGSAPADEDCHNRAWMERGQNLRRKEATWL